MAFEHKPGTGTLFTNSGKTNPKAPDFKGKFMTPGGDTIKLAGWWAIDDETGQRKLVGQDQNEMISLKQDNWVPDPDKARRQPAAQGEPGEPNF